MDTVEKVLCFASTLHYWPIGAKRLL